MATSLRQAIAAIQAHCLNAGIKEAPVDPVESNFGLPFSICYPNDGTIEGEASVVRRDLVNLFLDVHLSRQNLPLNVQQALSIWEALPDLLIADPTLGDNVDTLNGQIKFTFGNMSYAGVDTIGFRFTIPVKLRRSAT